MKLLDFDQDGAKSLAMIETSRDVPRPSYVITSSPGKFQVIWNVKEMTQDQAESLQRRMVQEFGADPAATDSSRVLRLPGFVNKKYAEPFHVVAEAQSRETYRFQDFKLSYAASEQHALTLVSASGRASSLAARTQSERDWKWAVRHVQQGESIEKVIQTLAAYRDDKANPEYYARRTVTRAYVKVALSEGADPEDVVRTISAHPPRLGINGEQYARATVEEFQMKLGRDNQEALAEPTQGAVQREHAQQLSLGVTLYEPDDAVGTMAFVALGSERDALPLRRPNTRTDAGGISCGLCVHGPGDRPHNRCFSRQRAAEARPGRNAPKFAQGSEHSVSCHRSDSGS